MRLIASTWTELHCAIIILKDCIHFPLAIHISLSYLMYVRQHGCVEACHVTWTSTSPKTVSCRDISRAVVTPAGAQTEEGEEKEEEEKGGGSLDKPKGEQNR